MIIVIRDEKGHDTTIKYESEEVFSTEDVKVYQATEWLTQKLIEDLLEIFEHIEEGYEEDEDVEEAVATIYDISKLYGVTWIADLLCKWEDKEITTTELLHYLHENT